MKRVLIILLLILLVAIIALFAYSLLGDLSPPEQEIIVVIPADGY